MQLEKCFLPNPGRLKELLIPENPVLVTEVDSSSRKTKYDLFGVYLGNELVCIDSRIPNYLIYESIERRELQEFKDYTIIVPEFQYGESRLDFHLSGENILPCLLEAKSCTLVRESGESKIALFPDAPTIRGKRHLEELMKAVEAGYRAVVVFVVHRAADKFSPNWETDQAFSKTLNIATQHGVEILVYQTEIYSSKMNEGINIRLNHRIPVSLNPKS